MHKSLFRLFYEKSPKSRFAVMFMGVLYVGMSTGFIFGIGASVIAAVLYLCDFRPDICKTVIYDGLKFENIFKNFISKETVVDSVNLLGFFTVTFNYVTVLIMRDVYKKKFRPFLAYIFSAILGIQLVCECYNIQKWFTYDLPFDFTYLILVLAAFFITAQLVLSNTIFMHFINLSAEQDKLLVDQATELITDTEPELTTSAPNSEISKSCGVQAHDNELI